MSEIMNKIADLVEEEVENRVRTRVENLINKIAKRHGVSKRLLIEDADDPSTSKDPSSVRLCMGTKTGGVPCKGIGKHNGFCRWHINQRRVEAPPPPPPPPVTVEHTHTRPPMFMRGCPACDTSF